ncbi:hypothetical protein HK098_000370 [Nowakowskiella sp. JEL0407]|nr:hypothetical protein HK098_000370 [Nowakowskiella sp. JEL0407]
MPLEIIGAGLPRTGTTSLKAALEELGYPTYHMVENIQHNDSEKWLTILKDNHGRDFKDWDYIFAQKGRRVYAASVDAPGCTFYKNLMEFYPDTKVILTVRDNPQVWVDSSRETVYKASQSGGGFLGVVSGFVFRNIFRSKMIEMINKVFFTHPDACNGALEKADFDGGKAAREFYTNWNDEVVKYVPSDKLLLFNVKEGWGPLCKFLGKPIPDKPFPRVNDRAEFQKHIKGMQNVGVGFLAIVGGVVGVVCGLVIFAL